MRRAAPTFVAAVIGAAVAVSGSGSEAQTNDASHAVALDWTAPGECPDIAYVESQIGALLAGGSAARVLRASAVVRREREGEWRVELATEAGGEIGHRALTAESCRAAADATALILALAVDPERVASNRPSRASASAAASSALPPPPPPPAASSAPPTPPLAPERSRVVAPSPLLDSTPPPPTTFELEVGGALEMGTLPSVMPAVLLTAAVVPRFARRLRILATGELSATSSVDSAAPVSGSFELRVVGVGGCYLPISGASELGLCAGAEVDSLAGSGLGETNPHDATATWVAVRPHVTLAYPMFGPWALRFDGGIGIALDRPEFDSTGLGGGFIHRPAEVSGRVSIGIEVRF